MEIRTILVKKGQPPLPRFLFSYYVQTVWNPIRTICGCTSVVREFSGNCSPMLHRDPGLYYLCSLLLMGIILAVNYFTLEVRHDCSTPLLVWGGMTYDLVHSLKNPPFQYPQCGVSVVYQFSATYSGVFLVSPVFHLFSVLVAFSKHPVLPSIIHFIETSTP